MYERIKTDMITDSKICVRMHLHVEPRIGRGLIMKGVPGGGKGEEEQGVNAIVITCIVLIERKSKKSTVPDTPIPAPVRPLLRHNFPAVSTSRCQAFQALQG